MYKLSSVLFLLHVHDLLNIHAAAAVIRSRRIEVIVALQNVARVVGFDLMKHNHTIDFSLPSCQTKKKYM